MKRPDGRDSAAGGLGNLAFSADQRRTLEELAAGTGPLRCPACGAILVTNEVPPNDRVSYVRHRVWVICPSCRRSAAVDLRTDRPR